MRATKLEQLGWMEVDHIQDTEGLLRLGKSLGRIVGDAQLLSPSDKQNATSRSFSYYYEHGQFPMHSDTAFWQAPARYVILKAQVASPTPTLLLPFPELQKIIQSARIETAIFSIRTTSGSHYGRAQFAKDTFGIRFDSCYMKSANRDAKALVDILSFPPNKLVERFEWRGTNALVIDNWRCLHARGSVAKGDSVRTLARIYVTRTER